MGRYALHPRYNVFHFRASDIEAEAIREHLNGKNHSEYFLTAAMEKIEREKGVPLEGNTPQ